MRRRTRSLAIVACLTTCIVAVGTDASADEAGDTANARALGVEGVILANAGRCAEAVEKLERAEALHHAPTTAARLGECEIELGNLLRGTERLQRVVREPLAPGAHGAFAVAVARAHKVLDASLPRLAKLRIGVVAPPGTKLSITVDGEAISEAVLDSERPIDPGSHVIKVAADGFLPSSITESLDEGQSKSVAVELHADPNARAAAARRAAMDAASVTRSSLGSPGTPLAGTEGGPSKVPAVLLMGMGALGLGVGIAGAVIVDHKTSALSTGCDANKVCPSSMQADLQAARTWATVSTVGFIGGGALMATGFVLLFVAPGSSSGNDPSAARARVRPVVGATSLGLDGVF